MHGLFCLIFSLLTFPAVAAWPDVKLEGVIMDEFEKPIKNAEVRIGEKELKTDRKGRIHASLKGKSIYQLKIDATGFYSRVQTFSHSELTSGHTLPFVLVKRQPKRVMMAFGGDVMLGRRYLKPYFDDPVLVDEVDTLTDAKKILAHIKPYMQLADFSVVNLESQVAEAKPKQRAPKSVTFYSEPELVDALLWAGVDYVTLGNNHTYDYLDEGLISTLDILNEKNLPFSGAGLTEQDALKPYVHSINKDSFAMLGYVGWQGSKSIKQTANQNQGGAAFGSMENMVTGVKHAVKSGEHPIVQYHGSLEYSNEPTGVTEQRLKSALDAGAVLAVAHHPHVAQGLELYDNKLIAYSMGNFVFDQNFSSTQLSFLMYVWLDEGQFHRAEIVPVYVKGYKPTPATGFERQQLLSRMSSLSAKRNTLVELVSGHGIIRSDTQGHNHSHTQKINLTSERNHKLPGWLSGKDITKVKLRDLGLKYRLGTNLINGHDFEQFGSFDTLERGFVYDKSAVGLNDYGYNSRQSLSLNFQGQQKHKFGMKHFRRVYRPSNPVTFKTQIKTSTPLKVRVFWQGRKTRQKLFDAFENNPLMPVQTIELTGGEDWQNLEIDFNSPRIGYRSYRLLVEIEPMTSQAQEELAVDIDDFSLIQWETAYQSSVKPLLVNDGSKMASFIGFDKVSNESVEIKF